MKVWTKLLFFTFQNVPLPPLNPIPIIFWVLLSWHMRLQHIMRYLYVFSVYLKDNHLRGYCIPRHQLFGHVHCIFLGEVTTTHWHSNRSKQIHVSYTANISPELTLLHWQISTKLKWLFELYSCNEHEKYWFFTVQSRFQCNCGALQWMDSTEVCGAFILCGFLA